MSFYNSPTYHLGSLNPVFNASDYETSASISLNEATADARYLKKSGGTMTGSLSVPNATISTSLSTPALTFSTNQISQTASQLGYIYSSTFTGITIANGAIVNLCQLSNLPIGVYIFYYNITFSSTSTSTITKKYFSISENATTISDTFKMRNCYLSGEPLSATTILQHSNTFLYKNTSTQTFYFNTSFSLNTSISASGLVNALRIA
jgi:hypothetical protein